MLVLLAIVAPARYVRADPAVSVTVISLEAKGIDVTVADLATDDLATAIEAEGIPVASNETLKAELKRRGLSQTCGVDDCPVAFDKIVKSTHLLRGSLFQIENRRVLKVTVETVSPRKPIFSGRREFERSDTSTTAAVKELAAEIIACLKGGSCKDGQPVQTSPAVAPKVATVSAPTAPSAAPSIAAAPVAAASSFIPSGPPDADGMITIPAGSFLYGGDNYGDNKTSISLPAFKIDKTEVTVSAYGKCVDAGKCQAPEKYPFNEPDNAQHPVIGVNWNDAKTYCEWSGKRLPTNQEWEKAARGTDGRTYPWGERAPTCRQAVMKEYLASGCRKERTWPVCSKPDGNSPYGLCDMAGNVSEWTADWYPGGQKYGVLRGSSWISDYTLYFQTNYLSPSERTSRSIADGFRCAQDVK